MAESADIKPTTGFYDIVGDEITFGDYIFWKNSVYLVYQDGEPTMHLGKLSYHGCAKLKVIHSKYFSCCSKAWLAEVSMTPCLILTNYQKKKLDTL